ncbi:hypothetical protein B0E45_00645 [Sinorhizobium sp. A49]|uniref:plant virulence effector HPE1-like domain-containing protein n=1 Tax=Sinorhizobium sp. A49 TaxID=1945861 RepID=UPI000987816D|nr:plant virulence effector HPE1-like domain-containing protein [Sinorhizobium sp. A49]OOG76688.1 hypothetical protein B0E45_00645 [Sinorhizobium sp. A49]
MRLLLITTAVALAAGSAWASSIDAVVSGQAVNSSVAAVTCPQCPPLQNRKKITYVVPEIEKGSAKVELKEINGEMKLVRTEAWLGGSPVVFVSKPSADVIKAASGGTGQADVATAAALGDLANPGDHGAVAPTIDETAKTAAVQTMTQAGPAVTAAATGETSRQFDPTSLELRLN